MKDKDLAINFDYTKFNPLNSSDFLSSVTIARTKSEFSLSILNISLIKPTDAFLVAMFNDFVDPNSFIDQFNERPLIISKHRKSNDAFDFAAASLFQWFREIGVDDPDLQYSHVIKDAKPNQPYISDDGRTRLSPQEELRRSQLLSRINKVGVRIPVIGIISALLD